MQPGPHVHPLAVALPGEDVRVHKVSGGDSEAKRLRELGLLEGRTIRIICSSDPMICQVGDCRFGLCRQTARRILVERIQISGNTPPAATV